ncbi:MAG TPA: hypothetical protein VNJ07_04230, partial [Chitinophagales bacterium]|nr:hypothetical protein [Chitinophagales bacterium]
IVMKSSDFHVAKKEIGGVKVAVTTYRIGDKWHCHISNADPGATIARAEGSTKEEAEKAALEKTTARLVKQ